MLSDLQAAPLLALEARRCEAIGSGDLEALADVLADDYLHVLANGRVVDKPQYIELIRKGPRRPQRGPLRVRTYGETAVITGALDNHLGAPGEPGRTIAAYCTQVARRQAGTWRFVSYILTQKR